MPAQPMREYRRGERTTLASGRTHRLVLTRPFVTGFNQGWFKNAFGSQWITNWDAAEARRLLAATARFGGRVFRIWMFEGLEPEGVIWDGDPTKSAWGYAGTRTRPTGLDGRKPENFRRFLELCKENGVRAYVTFFDANMYYNDPNKPHPQYERRKNEWWNVLNDKYDAGKGFLEKVIAPLLKQAQKGPSMTEWIFGFDLLNEFNALVKQNWFEGGWPGAVRFVRTWRKYIKEKGGDFKVTASFGHHDAVEHLLNGKLPKDAVDFYDFHAYSDKGDFSKVNKESELRELAKGTPIYLGEFGQSNPAFDDVLQTKVTRAFITRARKVGLAGAFAWRLSDIRPGPKPNPEARLSYEAFHTWRPAAYEFQAASRTP